MPQQPKRSAAALRGEWPMASAAVPSIEGSRPLRPNTLLADLGPEAAAALTAAGRRINLATGHVLWAAGESAALVCFPISGLVASLSVDSEGVAAQVDSVGPEGAAGLIEGLAGAPHSFESRALAPTDAWFVPAEAIRRLGDAHPGAADVLRTHVARLYDRSRRAIACCARHAMRARLADCLLAFEEKAQLSRLPLTQDMLSAVLGANRTTVTALMVAMSNEGLTRTGRGWVSIIDRDKLDRLACGCRKSAKPRKAAEETRSASRASL